MLTPAPGSAAPGGDPQPLLRLDGFEGPRDLLRDLARRVFARHADEYTVAFSAGERTAEVLGRVDEAAQQTGRRLVHSAAQVLCVGRDEDELGSRAAAIGRDPAELRETGVAGTPEEALARIARFADVGVTRLYLQVLDLADIGQLELVAEQVLPHV